MRIFIPTYVFITPTHTHTTGTRKCRQDNSVVLTVAKSGLFSHTHTNIYREYCIRVYNKLPNTNFWFVLFRLLLLFFLYYILSFLLVLKLLSFPLHLIATVALEAISSSIITTTTITIIICSIVVFRGSRPPADRHFTHTPRRRTMVELSSESPQVNGKKRGRNNIRCHLPKRLAWCLSTKMFRVLLFVVVIIVSVAITRTFLTACVCAKVICSRLMPEHLMKP